MYFAADQTEKLILVSCNVSQPLRGFFPLTLFTFVYSCHLVPFVLLPKTIDVCESSNLFTFISFYLICHGLLNLITFKSLI